MTQSQAELLIQIEQTNQVLKDRNESIQKQLAAVLLKFESLSQEIDSAAIAEGQ